MPLIRSLLVILSSSERSAWAQELLDAIPDAASVVVTGSPLDAAHYMAEQAVNPSHIVLDIGLRGQDILGEIDQLAQHCEPGTRVLAVGDTNDIILYRGLVSRGVIDYLPMPVAIADVVRVLVSVPVAAPKAAVAAAPAPVVQSKVRIISFMSAASGDGASIAALNTAYEISQMSGPTVLVDMDYQFGMVAKHLNLQNQYGIGDLFDHPERELDAVLIKRMVANYGKLHVITAPADLRFMPTVSSDAIRDLISILKQNYENIIFDLPHAWVPWVSSVVQQSTDVVLVAQLWLKSVSHAARMTRVFRDMGIANSAIHMVVNRSGARFKEGIDPKDFARVCGMPVRYFLANDIKTITSAEAAARTVVELGASSELAENITTMTRGLLGLGDTVTSSAGRGLLSRLKG